MTKKNAKDNGQSMSGWAKYQSQRYEAMRKRDADPFRKVRSEAWTSCGEGSTIEQRIAAANDAETHLRMTMGITEPLDLMTFADNEEHPFPSDARSLELFNASKVDESDPLGRDWNTIWTMTRPRAKDPPNIDGTNIR
jgi:hypothetical protein